MFQDEVPASERKSRSIQKEEHSRGVFPLALSSSTPKQCKEVRMTSPDVRIAVSSGHHSQNKESLPAESIYICYCPPKRAPTFTRIANIRKHSNIH